MGALDQQQGQFPVALPADRQGGEPGASCLVAVGPAGDFVGLKPPNQAANLAAGPAFFDDLEGLLVGQSLGAAAAGAYWTQSSASWMSPLEIASS